MKAKTKRTYQRNVFHGTRANLYREPPAVDEEAPAVAKDFGFRKGVIAGWWNEEGAEVPCVITAVSKDGQTLTMRDSVGVLHKGSIHDTIPDYEARSIEYADEWCRYKKSLHSDVEQEAPDVEQEAPEKGPAPSGVKTAYLIKEVDRLAARVGSIQRLKELINVMAG